LQKICIMEKWLDKLRKNGYRTTRSRREILRVLTFHETPLTPRQIREKIPQKIPDLSTIYRDLTLFEELEIVESIFTPLGNFYEMKDTPHHSHLICSFCHRVICVPCPLGKDDYPEHQVIFWGECDKCKKQRRER